MQWKARTLMGVAESCVLVRRDLPETRVLAYRTSTCCQAVWWMRSEPRSELCRLVGSMRKPVRCQ